MMAFRILVALLILAASLSLFLGLRHFQLHRVGRRISRSLDVNGPALLYFRSDHCAPCLTQSRYLDELEPSFQGRMIVRQFDVEMDQEVAGQYGVISLPTTILVDKRGLVRHINNGLTTSVKLNKQLENML